MKQSKQTYDQALAFAIKHQDYRATMEAVAGLLRLAGEAMDVEATQALDRELDHLMAANPRQIPPMAWCCKGVIAGRSKQQELAQRYFHRYLRAVRKELKKDSKNSPSAQLTTSAEAVVKAWTSLAMTLWQRGRIGRARWLALELLKRYESEQYRGTNGILYLLLGNIDERARKYDSALKYYQKAHGAFLAEHNWYHYLYVLYGYARLYRAQRRYPEAYLHLDLIEKACNGPEFGLLRHEIESERGRLQDDAVDLLIDSRKCIVKTRDGGQVSLRKQYVLLHILEALSNAHGRDGDDMDRGLSKSEIIEHVWNESYRPESHDNKLYYNINRLRKLIEPDVRKPQYLLNWKEGYRLAPGLRVQFIGARSGAQKKSE